MRNRINNTKEKTQRIANPMCPRLLPLRKAAEYLGLTVWAMRERIWAGEIPVVRFPGGRKMFIDVKDIDAFIEKNKTVVA
jgi:excisionase family DNA binding protein